MILSESKKNPFPVVLRNNIHGHWIVYKRLSSHIGRSNSKMFSPSFWKGTVDWGFSNRLRQQNWLDYSLIKLQAVVADDNTAYRRNVESESGRATMRAYGVRIHHGATVPVFRMIIIISMYLYDHNVTMLWVNIMSFCVSNTIKIRYKPFTKLK